MGRKIVVGDVHGAYKALKQALERCGFDFEEDEIISVGDLADGWSETPEAIELLMSAKKWTWVKGNHDEWALKGLTHQIGEPIDKHFNKFSMERDSWLQHGGKATLLSYSKERRGDLLEKHIEIFRNLPNYYLDDENRVFVHAGLPYPYPQRPDFELDLEEVNKKYPQTLYWERSFWYSTWAGKKLAKQFNEVYIGHTPTISHQSHKVNVKAPINRWNVWNMDTGAAFDGRLTLMDIDTKETWQSDPVCMLYPDEKGRNKYSWNNLNEKEQKKILNESTKQK